jgi:hypothetical protein
MPHYRVFSSNAAIVYCGRSLTIIVLSAFLSSLAFSQAVTAPAGWTSRQNGAAQEFIPDAHPNGEFTLDVYVDSPSPIADQWFNRRIEQDIARRGRPVQTGRVNRSPNGLLSVADTFRDASGKPYVVMYQGFAQPGRNAVFGIVRSPINTASYLSYIQQSGLIIGKFVRTSAAPQLSQSASVGPSASGGPAQPTPNQVQTREAERLRAIAVAQPGSGVQPSQISVLLYEGRGESTVLGYQYVETVHLVLTDGWACSHLEVPPSELNVEASRRLEAEKWHRWQNAGAKYRFQDSKTGVWQDVAADPVQPLPARLSSRLKTVKAYSFGGMGGSVFSRTIVFTPDGRYKRSNGAIQGSGAVQAAGGFNGSAASVQDKYGRRSSAGGANGSVAVATSSASAAGGGGMTGSYSVSGYTLELRGDDGGIQRILAFYPFPREDKSRIFLGDTTFNPQ